MVLPVNVTCQWNITAPVGKVVRLTVLGSFWASCSSAYMKVHDGPSQSSNIRQSSSEGHFFSSGRSVFIEAKTTPTDTIFVKVDYRAVDFQGTCNIFNSIAPKEVVPRVRIWFLRGEMRE